MRNELPLAYTLFRLLWSCVHVALAALAIGAILIWFFHDHQGMDLASSIWSTLTEIQYTIANAIHFPWGG